MALSLFLNRSHHLRTLGKGPVLLALQGRGRRVHPLNFQVARIFSSNSSSNWRGWRDKFEKVYRFYKDLLQPPEGGVEALPPQHVAGYKALAGGSFLGLGCLCFWGLIRPPSTSGFARMDLWAEHVKKRLRWTFAYLLGSAYVTAGSTYLVYQSRLFLRLIHSSPWVLFASSLFFQILTGVIVLNTSYNAGEPNILKHFFWILHCSILGLTIAPMCFLGGPIAARAFFGTFSVISSLALLALSAPEDAFLGWALPLGLGLGVTFGASAGSFFFPQTTRVGSTLFSIYLYGGMLLFSCMLLYDVQRVIRAAEKTPLERSEEDRFDPINGAMTLYMDCLNIYIRFLQLAAFQVSKRNK